MGIYRTATDDKIDAYIKQNYPNLNPAKMTATDRQRYYGEMLTNSPFNKMMEKYLPGWTGDMTESSRKAWNNVIGQIARDAGIDMNTATPEQLDQLGQAMTSPEKRAQVQNMRTGYAETEKAQKNRQGAMLVGAGALPIGIGLAGGGVAGAGAGNGFVATTPAGGFTSGALSGATQIPMTQGISGLLGSSVPMATGTTSAIAGGGGGLAGLAIGGKSLWDDIGSLAGTYGQIQQYKQQAPQLRTVSDLNTELLKNLGDQDALANQYATEFYNQNEPRISTDMYKRGLLGSSAYGSGLADLARQSQMAGEQMRQARLSGTLNTLNTTQPIYQNLQNQQTGGLYDVSQNLGDKIKSISDMGNRLKGLFS